MFCNQSEVSSRGTMDYHVISVCSPKEKKRKLADDVTENISVTTTAMTRGGGGCGRHFLSIPRSEHVFQTEEWRSGGSALFLPLQEDLLVNVRRVEQVSCSEGHYFVADHSGKYSCSLSGKVIHLWRFDKEQKKLYISRSFLFTAQQEYLTVQQYLQGI